MESARYLRTKRNRYRDWGRGEIFSFTVIKDLAWGFIKLEAGKYLLAPLTEVDTPTIGLAVECVLRIWEKDDDKNLIIYGYAFRPMLI